MPLFTVELGADCGVASGVAHVCYLQHLFFCICIYVSTYIAMDVSQLLKDELVFEVGIRGYSAVPTDTVKSLSKKLRGLLRREANEEELQDILLPISVEEEVLSIDFKLTDLSILISAFQDSKEMKKALRTRTLMSHLNGRLSRLYKAVAKVPKEKEMVKPLLVSLKECVGMFRTFGSEAPFDASSVMSFSTIVKERKSSENSDSKESEDKSRDSEHTSEGKTGPDPKFSDNKKAPDFHKWGISYSGSEDKSVLSFIVDIEEKATWKGVPFNKLVLGASEFFTGHAKTWFRSIRSQIDSWDELKIALRKEFLPLNYHEILWEEVRARKQGKKESMGEYVANMMSLFERLEFLEPVTDGMKLRVLKNNLAPFYLSK